jgi:hypothetical protein
MREDTTESVADSARVAAWRFARVAPWPVGHDTHALRADPWFDEDAAKTRLRRGECGDGHGHRPGVVGTLQGPGAGAGHKGPDLCLTPLGSFHKLKAGAFAGTLSFKELSPQAV